MARIDRWLDKEGLEMLAGWSREGLNLEEIAVKILKNSEKYVKNNFHLNFLM